MPRLIEGRSCISFTCNVYASGVQTTVVTGITVPIRETVSERTCLSNEM